MRQLIICLFVTLLTFSFILDAQAKRFGGGRSFGMSRPASSYNYSRTASPLNAAAAASPTHRWLGPLAGLAAGGLLASLFMGHGIGSGILSWLLVLGGAFFIWQFIRNRMQPQSTPMAYSSPVLTPNNPQNNSRFNPFNMMPQGAVSTPATFNTDEFLHIAKAQFIRLQAAHDTKNVADLHEFTTPEVFAEIQLQLQERGQTENITEVVSLNAELLGTETLLDHTIASVRFSGSIKEDPNQTAQPFEETWHFKKNQAQSAWKVAGLEQI